MKSFQKNMVHLNLYRFFRIIIATVVLLSVLEIIALLRNSSCYFQPAEVFIQQHIKIPKKSPSIQTTPKQLGTAYLLKLSSEMPVVEPAKPVVQPAKPVANTQVKRQLLLREYCKNNTKLLRRKFQLKNPNMLVSDKAATIYCYVPKVACTNWKRVFQVLEGKIEDPLDIPKKEKVHVQKYLSYKDLSTNEIAWRRNLFYSFMFVRHPFERVLSAYRNKFLDPYNDSFNRVHGSKVLRMFRTGLTENEYKAGKNVTFPEFSKYIVNTFKKHGYGGLNEHWQLMHKLCNPCHMKYNFIGKMDSLVEDADLVLEEISRSEKVKFPAQAKDKYKTNLNVLVKKYYAQLPKSVIKELYRIYEDDFKAFGYSAEDYL